MKTKSRSDRRAKPEYQIKIAKERIGILIDHAVNASKDNPKMARRYYRLAKKIGMRYNVRMPKHLKRRFCKYCFSYLESGWRFKKGRMYITCSVCGKIIRYPYKPKR